MVKNPEGRKASKKPVAKRRSSGNSPKKRRGKSAEQILAAVAKYYLASGDFNGLPVRTLYKDDTTKALVRTTLRQLIDGGQITMEFGIRHINPHIKALPPDPSQNEQLQELTKNDLESVCAYPSPAVLATVVGSSECHDRPFTRRLMLGEAQLAFHAFDLSVLELYRNDPRYYYTSDDIRGSISIHDAFYQHAQMHERDRVLLQTFGFGYDESLNRAVMVFTRYLHDLSPEHQQIWNAKRLNGSYKLHPDYYRNAIVGAWGTKLSLFQAFLEELKHINAMAKLIGKPALFRNEFEERPRGFSFLVRPTTKEFNDFVLLLDQTMSDNLNKDFFRGDIDLESETTRPDGKIVIAQKGTIQLLEQWFQKKMRFSDPQPFNDMLAIFREVRKARQHPAHTAEDSIFDQKIFKDQRELAVRAYDAVRTIRLMLANHPAVRDYKVPEKLFKGEIWTY